MSFECASVEDARQLTGPRPSMLRAAGTSVGHALTAVDIYTATVMAMFSPLPEALCTMDPTARTVFETLDAATRAALAPAAGAPRQDVRRAPATPLSL